MLVTLGQIAPGTVIQRNLDAMADMAGRAAAGHPNLAYNTVLVFDPHSRRLAAYRKIHLFDSQELRESAYIKPAPDLTPVNFSADGIIFGVLARALDNGVFVVTVSQAEPVSIGRSLVAGPLGSVLAECDSGVQSLTVDLDANEVEHARQVFPLRSQQRIRGGVAGCRGLEGLHHDGSA